MTGAATKQCFIESKLQEFARITGVNMRQARLPFFAGAMVMFEEFERLRDPQVSLTEETAGVDRLKAEIDAETARVLGLSAKGSSA